MSIVGECEDHGEACMELMCWGCGEHAHEVLNEGRCVDQDGREFCPSDMPFDETKIEDKA